MGERVFLGLGSNVGRRPDHLRRALRIMKETPDIRVVRPSFLYKTSPVGYTPQRDFLNGAVEIRTSMPPRTLLAQLQDIEKRVGKQVLFTDGPRKIDIDLLLFGKRVSREKELVIPHPLIHKRKFVLVPLAELAPRVRHPVSGATLKSMLKAYRGDERVAPWGPWESGTAACRPG